MGTEQEKKRPSSLPYNIGLFTASFAVQLCVGLHKAALRHLFTYPFGSTKPVLLRAHCLSSAAQGKSIFFKILNSHHHFFTVWFFFSCVFSGAQCKCCVCVFALPTGLTDADAKKLRLGRSVLTFPLVALVLN